MLGGFGDDVVVGPFRREFGRFVAAFRFRLGDGWRDDGRDEWFVALLGEVFVESSVRVFDEVRLGLGRGDGSRGDFDRRFERVSFGGPGAT